MPSSKRNNKKDVSRYAFANNYQKVQETNSNENKKSDSELRKIEYTKRKEKERKEKQIELEKEKVKEERDKNYMENEKIIKWIISIDSTLNDEQIFWLSSSLGKIKYDIGKLLYVNKERNVMGCEPNYMAIYMPKQRIYFWEIENIHKDIKLIKIPEIISSFVQKNLKIGVPQYPKQDTYEKDFDYKKRCDKTIIEFLQ